MSRFDAQLPLADQVRAVRDAYLMATPDKDDTAWAVLTRAADALRPQTLTERAGLGEAMVSSQLYEALKRIAAVAGSYPLTNAELKHLALAHAALAAAEAAAMPTGGV